MLIDFTEGKSDEFLTECKALEESIAESMDLLGGWSPSMARQSQTRSIGMYVFNPTRSEELHYIAKQLGKIYEKLGRRLESTLGINAKLLKHLSADQQSVLATAPTTAGWATTLRADFLYESDALKIVEVNTDNVAGVEDLILQYWHYLEKAPKTVLPVIRRSEERIANTLISWIAHHYSLFTKRAVSDKPPQIAIVFADRDESMFFARVLEHLLVKHTSWNVLTCRPENLVRDNGELAIRLPRGETFKADLILRHYLFFEMFNTNTGQLLPEFAEILAAEAEHRALFLNPTSERRIFSKALMTELWDLKNKKDSFLDSEERAFIDDYLVPTENAQYSKDDPIGYITKPADSYGGNGIRIRYSEDSSGILGDPRFSDYPWVRQPALRAECFERWTRVHPLGSDASLAIRVPVFTVHGLLIHKLDQHQLTGVMTRVGPDPIVNWSRGAAVLPALLTNSDEEYELLMHYR